MQHIQTAYILFVTKMPKIALLLHLGILQQFIICTHSHEPDARSCLKCHRVPLLSTEDYCKH